jgi:hypothetical protein
MREGDPAAQPPGHRAPDHRPGTGDAPVASSCGARIPDEELLPPPRSRQLSKPAVLQSSRSARMLNDPRAKALTANFAGQWLHLRKPGSAKARPPSSIPNFDQRLRAAMLTETEMFFETVIRENRSALDFLDADYTFLNQRLAEHYGIPGIYGTTFRKVSVDPKLRRGGLLGQASILTVTLQQPHLGGDARQVDLGKHSGRTAAAAAAGHSGAERRQERQAAERARADGNAPRQPVCASCHNKMDPLGFSLENYDAVGAWRTSFAGKPIDALRCCRTAPSSMAPRVCRACAAVPQGTVRRGADRAADDLWLGRGVEYYDMPAVREVRDHARQDDYRMNTIIMGIVQSVPFVMKKVSAK